MPEDIRPPPDLDWQCWVDSWDRMQERYLVKRAERFEIIVRLIRETRHSVEAVLGPGDPVARRGETGRLR